MNVPERIPLVPEVGTMVPNPPLYNPIFAPEVNLVGSVEKLLKPISGQNRPIENILELHAEV